MHKAKILKVFCCSACSEVEVKTTMPNLRGCKKTGLHNWVLMGEKGLGKYVCKGCGVKVNTTDVPTQYPCTGGAAHQWEKK